jgi:hypothetical protein
VTGHDTQLSRDDDEVAGATPVGIRTERFGHGAYLAERVAATAGARRVGVRDVESRPL